MSPSLNGLWTKSSEQIVMSGTNKNTKERWYDLLLSLTRSSIFLSFSFSIYDIVLSIAKATNELSMLVFNDTFSNISYILVVSVPGENYPTCCKSLKALSHEVVANMPRHERDSKAQL